MMKLTEVFSLSPHAFAMYKGVGMYGKNIGPDSPVK